MITSDLIRLDAIDGIFRQHLKVIMIHNSTSFTSTHNVNQLFNDKPKIKILREEAAHKRQMVLQHSEQHNKKDL